MAWYNIFGGSENVGKAIDVADKTLSGIGGWIDKQKFTEEEKSIALAKAVDSHLELVKATANENSLRSVTRRWLACGIVGFILFWTSVAIILSLLDMVDKSVTILDLMVALGKNILLITILGFYFGVSMFRK